MTPDVAKGGAVRNFYLSVIDESELLAAAHELEGIDDEITLLRVRVKERIGANPDHYRYMLEGVQTIVRAVAARYRMSARHKHELAESLAESLRHVAEEMMPQRAEDV